MVPHPPTDVCWYIWTICSFIWARQLVPFPLCLSIASRLPWPTFPAPFATSDDRWSLTFLQQMKLLPMNPFLLFAFLAGRKSDPFIFPKIFTNSLAHLCHKYSPQNLPSSVVLPKHWTLQEFWHTYKLILFLYVWVFSLSKIRFYKIKLIFPNQTEFGLEFSGRLQWPPTFSKPNWIWFGICVLQNSIFSFQTKLELVWKIRRIFWVYLFQTKLDLVWKRTLNKM